MTARRTALEDLLVVDLSRSFWSALGGALLADFGARVVHVRDTEAGFDWEPLLEGAAGRDYLAELVHRNKQSFSASWKEPEGAALVRRLIDRADVLLVDWPRRELEALGWDAETLCAANPGLIYARGSGFGPEGPDRDAPALDELAAARTGVMPTLPQPGEPPVFPESGPLYTSVMLALGIMLAEHHRAETGEGQVVDASLLGGNMYGASLDLQAFLAIRGDAFLGPTAQVDRGNPMSGTLYLTSDERWVTLTMPDTDRWWPAFSELVGIAEDDPRFDDHEKRTEANRRALMDAIDAAVRKRSAGEWRALFQEKSLSADIIEEFDYPAEDREARENRYVLELDDPHRGRIRTLGFPIYMSDTPARLDQATAARGQHSARVLHDLLDLSEARIDELCARRVIRA